MIHHAFSISNPDLPAMIVPGTRGVEVVLLNDLIRLQSISNYSKLFFSNGKTIVVAKTLSSFDDQLSDYGFVRVHRTHLVNKDFVSGYSTGPYAEIELLNGERIEISRRKRQSVLKEFQGKLITLYPPRPINKAEGS
jgi:two-component system, LytTR family, response regulator